jgi:hypothetical protein
MVRSVFDSVYKEAFDRIEEKLPLNDIIDGQKDLREAINKIDLGEGDRTKQRKHLYAYFSSKVHEKQEQRDREKLAEENAKRLRESQKGRTLMDIQKQVLETGQPVQIKQNERYEVRQIKHGKYTRSVVISKATGKYLRRGSNQERKALIELLV